MSRDLNNLIIDPFFLDVISGEFTPPTNDLEPCRTLGKLAFLTFNEGAQTELQLNSSLDIIYIDCHPYWAENVNAQIAGFKDNENGLMLLKAVNLRNQDDETLSIISDISRASINDTPKVHVWCLGEYLFLPLSPDNQRDITKSKISHLAHKFFRLDGSCEYPY